MITIGPNTLYSIGPYGAYLNTFGTAAPVVQEMLVNPATFPNGSMIVWAYPMATGPLSIQGFQQAVSYGDYYGTVPQSVVTPKQIKTIGTLTTNFSISWGGTPNGYDVIHDMFLTATPDGDASHLFEVEIFLHVSPYALTYAQGLTQLGTVTISGIVWTVSINRGMAAPAILFLPPGDVNVHTIDVGAALKWLVSINVLTGNEYFNGLTIGAEVAQGCGYLGVNYAVVTYN